MYKVQTVNRETLMVNYHRPFENREEAEAHVLELFKRYDEKFLETYMICMLMPENEQTA